MVDALPKPSVLPEEFAKTLNAATKLEDKVSLVKARAAQLFKEGFPKLALDMYSKQLSLQQTHQAFSNRSACHCALRDYTNALTDAERARACTARACPLLGIRRGECIPFSTQGTNIPGPDPSGAYGGGKV